MPELILSLRERELGRFPILATRTTIGRDPSCDIVIDNAGVSRLHASLEVVGDSFVLRDCESQNGVTLNGDPCSEGRVVHGDMIGLNKFLLRFSNHDLEVPSNLQTDAEKPRAAKPKEVQRTMHLDADAAQALTELAKQQVAKKRAELAASGGESLPPVPKPVAPPAPAAREDALDWEEPSGSGVSMPVVFGGLLVASALIGGVLWIVH
jgi:predicted component of type VI protein secretion system